MSRFVSSVKARTALFGTVAAVGLAGATIMLQGHTDAQAAPAAAAVPVAVGVQTVNTRPVQMWSEFSGRMQAVDFAEIRPEVGGRITEVRIHDGQTVKAGEILFVIDPRPYQAVLAKASANLASAQTNAAFAKMELERAANMVKSQAIAQRLYDERANADRVAEAAVQAAEAELKQAEIDLDHAFVKAPIGGRISRPEITLGNLVQSGATAPILTSIVSNNGIYAAFEVDEQTYLRSVRGQDNTEDKLRHMPVELALQGDVGRIYHGTVYSFDNRIDTSTGTIRARAKFENKDGSLVPGMFVTVRLANSDGSTAILVPDRAIGNDQSKKYVYVVGNDAKVAYREIRVGQQVEGQRIVLSGLADGDRVIVEGQQHVRPDQIVQIRQVAEIEAQPRPRRLAAD